MPVAIPIASLAIGAGETIYKGIQAHKTQEELERKQSLVYTPSQSIADYYQKALARYSLNPYQNAAYQQQLQNIQSAQAAGIQGLQDRRSAIGGVGAVVAGSQGAQLANTAAVQQQQSSALAQLGQAAGAQTQQQEQAFDINQVQPFTRNYNLLAMKAAGQNQVANAGLQTFNSGLNSLSNQMMLNKMYGTNNGSSSPAPYNLSGTASSVYSRQPNTDIPMGLPY
jgi:hypothetical protein